MQASEGTAKRKVSPLVWTMIVVGLGLALGAILALTSRPARPGPIPPFERFHVLDDIDVILSTTGLALLVALLYVYTKTYGDTGARFALGLVFVLVALFLQGVLTSPLLFGAFGHGLGGLGPFILAADAFKDAAFAVFLYLSLQ